MNSKSKGSEWDLGEQILTEGTMRGSHVFKEFRVHYDWAWIGNVWPRLCGQKGTFLKVLAMRRNLTTGCPWRAQEYEPRQRQAPQVHPGGNTWTRHRVAVEVWAGLPKAPLLPCPESDSRKKKTLISRTLPHLRPPGCPEDAQRGRAGREQDRVYLLPLSDECFPLPCTDSAPVHTLGNL